MKKIRLAGILIAVVLISVIIFISCSKNKQNSAGMQQKTFVAVRGPIEETIEATGEVLPLNRVEIKPPIQGRIETILVDEGTKVKQGQILAWMSSSDRAAVLDSARAQGPEELKKWEDAYKPTPIIAPLSGVIILRNIVVGQTVDVGTVMFALSDKLIILTNVDEVDIGHVKVGMPARIKLDAYPNENIPGKVFSILYEGTNVSNVITYGVKVEPDWVPPFFRSQMTANISLIATVNDNAVLVPSLAVTDDSSGGKQVLVSGPEGKSVSQPVKIGIDNGDQVEILSGLNPGDTVIITSKEYKPQQKETSTSPFGIGGRPHGGSSGSQPRNNRGSGR